MYPSYEDARMLCEQSMTRPFRTLTPRECEQTAVEFHAQREALKRELARLAGRIASLQDQCRRHMDERDALASVVNGRLDQRDMMACAIDRLRAENASLLADMDALTRP